MLVQDGIFDIADTEEDALFRMANLYPKTTGLPRVVYASERGNARHDARVKVSGAPGDKTRRHDMATMSVRPESRLLHGELPAFDEQVIARWIQISAEALLDYWNEVIDTEDLLARLQRV